MSQGERTYIAIDLKSFYASVECVERNLNPLTTNLVVADSTRTEKTICLAVTPSLKVFGLSGRSRLYQVVEKVKEINAERRQKLPGRKFSGESFCETELQEDPSLELKYIVAKPRMAKYVEYSNRIFKCYLQYVAPEDISAYSIDEVFMDVTEYLKTYGLTPMELARKMVLDVLHQTGITATAGIGTNLYLCKIAMDLDAKHIPPDENGVRIAQLTEHTYRERLWAHTPITDFWRVGPGYARKLREYGMTTMGDVARCSVGAPGEFYNEDLLYRLFGVNAELLIDHAWGWEPCTLKEIKNYRPSNNSLSTGQVLKTPYDFQKGKLIVREMAELLSLDLVEKNLVTDQLVLHLGYDIENLLGKEKQTAYQGPVETDHYGRKVPKASHGSESLGEFTSSTRRITQAILSLYEKIANPALTIRRVNVIAGRVITEEEAGKKQEANYEQITLFQNIEEKEKEEQEKKEQLKREKQVQKAVVSIKQKYGKNAILKGMNLKEGGTTIERNGQIGGHKA